MPKYTAQQVLDAILNNKVDLEFSPRIVWLRPRKNCLDIVNEPTGIKLKGHDSEESAVIAGLVKLGLL